MTDLKRRVTQLSAGSGKSDAKNVIKLNIAHSFPHNIPTIPNTQPNQLRKLKLAEKHPKRLPINTNHLSFKQPLMTAPSAKKPKLIDKQSP